MKNLTASLLLLLLFCTTKVAAIDFDYNQAIRDCAIVLQLGSDVTKRTTTGRSIDSLISALKSAKYTKEEIYTNESVSLGLDLIGVVEFVFESDKERDSFFEYYEDVNKGLVTSSDYEFSEFFFRKLTPPDAFAAWVKAIEEVNRTAREIVKQSGDGIIIESELITPRVIEVTVSWNPKYLSMRGFLPEITGIDVQPRDTIENLEEVKDEFENRRIAINEKIFLTRKISDDSLKMTQRTFELVSKGMVENPDFQNLDGEIQKLEDRRIALVTIIQAAEAEKDKMYKLYEEANAKYVAITEIVKTGIMDRNHLAAQEREVAKRFEIYETRKSDWENKKREFGNIPTQLADMRKRNSTAKIEGITKSEKTVWILDEISRGLRQSNSGEVEQRTSEEAAFILRTDLGETHSHTLEATWTKLNVAGSSVFFSEESFNASLGSDTTVINTISKD